MDQLTRRSGEILEDLDNDIGDGGRMAGMVRIHPEGNLSVSFSPMFIELLSVHDERINPSERARLIGNLVAKFLQRELRRYARAKKRNR